jgi:cytochrome P450/NADPH-cytochrome P450 reductase
MRFPGHTFIIANNYAMVNEFCDEKRFPKTIFALKVQMRHKDYGHSLTHVAGDETRNA